MSWQQGIGRRIPPRVIGTMQDAAELAGIFAEDDVEFIATFRLEDFLLMMLADGGDAVSENDAGFQKIEAPEKLDPTEREKTLRQTRETEINPPTTSLLGPSMDRQDRTAWQVSRMEVNRDEGRAPTG